MEQQLYREVNDGVGTKLIEVSEEEVKAAKEKYAKTGECDCIYIYDELWLVSKILWYLWEFS